MNMVAELKLFAQDGRTLLMQKTISFGDGFVLVWSISEVSGWYKKFLTRMLGEVEAVLESQEFQALL